jgi:hypothetical protein
MAAAVLCIAIFISFLKKKRDKGFSLQSLPQVETWGMVEVVWRDKKRSGKIFTL